MNLSPHHVRQTGLLLFAAVLIVAAVGCKTSPPDLTDSAELARVRKKWIRPFDIDVLVGIEACDGPDILAIRNASAFRVAPDTERYVRSFSHVFDQGGWFQKTVVLGDGRQTRIRDRMVEGKPVPEVRRNGTGREYFLKEARRLDADYLILVRPGPSEVSCDGTSPALIWSVIVWSLFIPPTWWIPDEVFSGRFDTTVEIVGVKAPFEGSSARFRNSRKITRHLCDIDRGLQWIDLTPIPAETTAAIGRRAATFLSDWYLYDVTAEILDRCHGFFADQVDRTRRQDRERQRSAEIAAAKAAWEASLRQNQPVIAPRLRLPWMRGGEKPPEPRGYAVIAGHAPAEGATVPGTRYARADARRIADFFGGVFPFEKSAPLNVMVGAKATKRGLERAVEDVLLAAPKSGDCIVMSLSGAGKADLDEDGNPDLFFLASGEPSSSAKRNLFAVGHACEQLARTKAARIVVILDMAFGAKGLRSLGADEGVVQKAVERLVRTARFRDGFFLLMADDGHGEALELRNLGQGLFTSVLTEVLESGESWLEKIEAAVAGKVAKEAAMRARKQTPLFAGDTSRPLK